MMISEPTNINAPPLFSSSLDMRIHPLSASPATNAFFQTGTNLTDDVTTIFVVGFPDDMTEREFQNMFTFCPGFEAASLKWHCKDQEDDNSVGSNGGKKQMIGFARFRTRLEAMEAVEVLGGKKIDQEKGTVLKAEMAKKNLHVKRGSVAPTTNTFLPSTPTTQQTSSSIPSAVPLDSPTTSTNSTSTTTIFPGTSNSSITATTTNPTTTTTSSSSATSTTIENTTNEIAPTTTMEERTITASISTTPTSSTPTSMGGNSNTMIGEGTMSLLSKKLGRQHGTTSSGSYDAFSPLPSDLLSPADYKTDPFMNDPFTCSTPTTPIFSDALFGNLRSNSFDGRQPDIGLMSPPRHFGNGIGIGNASSTNTNSNGILGFNQGQSNGNNTNFNNSGNNNFIMGPSPLGKTNNFGNLHHPLQNHPLHHPYQIPPSFGNNNNNNNGNNMDDDHYNYLSKSSPISNDRLFGTSPIFDDLLTSRMGSLTMQANNLTDLRSPSISSIHRPSNPADQNPPCNTLYVGNLPPNTNEDELRQLFSQCRGYKRMCFRNKPQGPMCFVEFEDVVLATNALNEYQGHCLTTSAKGGIRLSFSKNPLFIKGPGGTPMNQNNSGDSNNKGGNNKNSINNGKIGVSSTDQQL